MKHTQAFTCKISKYLDRRGLKNRACFLLKKLGAFSDSLKFCHFLYVRKTIRREQIYDGEKKNFQRDFIRSRKR